MQCVTLTLTAKEPLVITQGSAEGMGHNSLAYIPGNMLLGAFAGLWRQVNPGLAPDDATEFRTLFLTGAAQWGHAYPLLNNTPCVPMPLCLQAFKGKNTLDAPNGCALNMLQCNENDPEWAHRQFHSFFDEPFTKLTRHGGAFLHPETCRQPEIVRQWNMHVTLHEAQRAARQGQLFGFDAIAPGAQFSSAILCRSAEEAAAIAALAGEGKEIRVGHARSAGYGCVAMHVGSMEPCPEQRVSEEDGRFVLFFVSDYAPRFGWQTPYESLREELEEMVGACVLEKSFMEHDSIAGFNGLWKMPRATRTVLRKGSVVVVRLKGSPVRGHPFTLPASLGGGKTEGYGRILLNPEFLEKEVLHAGELAPQARVAVQSSALAPSDPMLLVLRQRALALQAKQEALRQLDDPAMQDFVRKAARLPRPGQGQRGNVRQLVTMHPQGEWAQKFAAALQKNTVNKHWQEAAPHPRHSHKEHVECIMKLLLDSKQFSPASPTLPGGPVNEAEQRTYAAMAHKQFMLGLLAQWEKESRTHINKGGRS